MMVLIAGTLRVHILGTWKVETWLKPCRVKQTCGIKLAEKTRLRFVCRKNFVQDQHTSVSGIHTKEERRQHSATYSYDTLS